VIALDTSVLIDSLTGSKRSSPELRHLIEIGQRILVPALVFYEWLRGPRLPEELAAQEALFPGKAAIVFGMEEAILSSRIYRSVSRPRGREIDLAIAACAIARGADLWTLNTADFEDIPSLTLYRPPRSSAPKAPKS
jgi:predicted nucleic acid-binding protein